MYRERGREGGGGRREGGGGGREGGGRGGREGGGGREEGEGRVGGRHKFPLTHFILLPRVQECRFYDSKMRPLLLVYENPDPSALLQDIHIIFKNGDGNDL